MWPVGDVRQAMCGMDGLLGWAKPGLRLEAATRLDHAGRETVTATKRG